MDRIRILFLHDKLVCGGAEQALYDLIYLMDKEKFDITVLVLKEGGEWEDKFRDAGIRVESVWSCQKKSKNPLIKLENWSKRKKIVKATKNRNIGLIDACFELAFDIVVLYHVGGAQEIAFAENAKTIKFIHNNPETNRGYRQDLMNAVETIKQIDKIICVSNDARIAFEKYTGISQNVAVHFNPLNSERVKALSTARIEMETEDRMICAVGRLTDEKGFERLIRIHKKVYDEGYKHKLVIVGEGPMRELLENIIRSVHCEDSVELVGYKANPYPYMKNCHFVVCPSYTEGLSMIAMEALALGTPVVSAAPTVGELFGDETCGIITNSDDAGLEAGIRRMISDSAFYMIAKAGAEKRSLYFNGKSMVKEIEHEFVELLNS